MDYEKAPFIYWWVIFSTGDSVTDWFTNKNKLSFHPFFNEYIGRFTRWFYKSINQPWACIKKFFNKHSWHKLIKVTLILQKERGFCLITHGLTKILRFLSEEFLRLVVLKKVGYRRLFSDWLAVSSKLSLMWYRVSVRVLQGVPKKIVR